MVLAAVVAAVGWASSGLRRLSPPLPHTPRDVGQHQGPPHLPCLYPSHPSEKQSTVTSSEITHRGRPVIRQRVCSGKPPDTLISCDNDRCTAVDFANEPTSDLCQVFESQLRHEICEPLDVLPNKGQLGHEIYELGSQLCHEFHESRGQLGYDFVEIFKMLTREDQLRHRFFECLNKLHRHQSDLQMYGFNDQHIDDCEFYMHSSPQIVELVSSAHIVSLNFGRTSDLSPFAYAKSFSDILQTFVPYEPSVRVRISFRRLQDGHHNAVLDEYWRHKSKIKSR